MNFIQFAEAHGLQIEHLIEGRWARVRTFDKHRKRNGAYKFLGDIGFVQNHATMDEVAIWRPDAPAQRVNRFQLREIQRKQQERQEHLWADARIIAEDMIDRARWEQHPYLMNKGFPDVPGFVLERELLVPMRDFHDARKLNSLQRIMEDGTKLFLTGGKARASVLKLGNQHAPECWLVEGYATGLSVRAALRDLRRDYEIIVCFSASNMRAVAPLVRKRAFVMADNDESGTGRAVAESTDLKWVMPTEVGMDANDLHQRYRLRALVKLIRSV